MAERPLPAYDGDETYLFVAYSHEDSDLVFPQIRWLQDQGFNIAWDEGISPGAVWRSEIAEAIRGCSLLLYFTTPNSVVSEHCTREVNFALDEHHRPVLAVHLIETTLPDALALSLSDRQAILQYALEPEDYERKLISAVATYLNQPLPAVSLPAPSRKSSRQVSWAFAVVCSLVVGSVVAVLATWLEVDRDPPAPPGMVLPLGLQHFSYHPDNNLALSSDGRIAYVGVEEGERFLYLKSTDALRPDKLPGTNGARAPFFSPNGNWLGFFAQGKLKRSPVGGGNPVDIAHSRAVLGASWGDDNHIVFTTGWKSPLMRIAADGGDAEAVTRLKDNEGSHRNPFVLPGSRAILYQNHYEIWVEDLTSGESWYLARGGLPQYYEGKLLFYREKSANTGSLWMVNFNPDTLTTDGDPEPLVEATRSSFAINNNGALVYSVPSPTRNRLLLFDETTGEARVIAEEHTRGMRFSTDGRRLAVPRTLNGQIDIWIYDLNSKGAGKQLSLDGGEWPIWSPDSTKIAYQKPGTGIVIRSTDASDPPAVLIESDVTVWPQQWNPQGILYTAINKGTQGDLYFVANSGDETVVQDDVVASPHSRISPDGAWIATARYETEEPDVWVEPFPDGGPRQRVPVVNGSWPTWSADGEALYVTSSDRLMRVPVTQDTGGIKFGKPAIIRELGRPSNIASGLYDVSPDESQIVVMDVEYLNPPVQALVINWPEVLLD